MKMIITDNRPPPSQNICANLVPVGHTFRGSIGSFSGIFLRVYNSIVLLNDPSHVWMVTGAPLQTPITNYQPVQVEVIVR